jgi:hypothetical protein
VPNWRSLAFPEDGMSFVQANINNPTLLFNISQEYGLSYAVLGRWPAI